MYKALKR